MIGLPIQELFPQGLTSGLSISVLSGNPIPMGGACERTCTVKHDFDLGNARAQIRNTFTGPLTPARPNNMLMLFAFIPANIGALIVLPGYQVPSVVGIGWALGPKGVNSGSPFLLKPTFTRPYRTADATSQGQYPLSGESAPPEIDGFIRGTHLLGGGQSFRGASHAFAIMPRPTGQLIRLVSCVSSLTGGATPTDLAYSEVGGSPFASIFMASPSTSLPIPWLSGQFVGTDAAHSPSGAFFKAIPTLAPYITFDPAAVNQDLAAHMVFDPSVAGPSAVTMTGTDPRVFLALTGPYDGLLIPSFAALIPSFINGHLYTPSDLAVSGVIAGPPGAVTVRASVTVP